MFKKVAKFFERLLPEDYSVGVAIKKVSYFVGKLAAGFVLASFVTKGQLTASSADQIQVAFTGLFAAGMEAIHDWAKMKWPDAPLL